MAETEGSPHLRSEAFSLVSSSFRTILISQQAFRQRWGGVGEELDNEGMAMALERRKMKRGHGEEFWKKSHTQNVLEIGERELMGLRRLEAVFIQVLCSYNTLPLYALVTQTGDHYNKEVFEELQERRLHDQRRQSSSARLEMAPKT